MKKKTYKLIENISESIMHAFPYLTVKEHSEIMENFIYESLIKNLKLSEYSVKVPKYNVSMPKYTYTNKPKYTFSDKHTYHFDNGSFYDPPKKPKKEDPWKIDGENQDIILQNARDFEEYQKEARRKRLENKKKWEDEENKRYEERERLRKQIAKDAEEREKLRYQQYFDEPKKETSKRNSKDSNSSAETIAIIAALAGTTIAGAITLYKKYGPSIVEKLQKSAPPSRLEKAKLKFKELMKKIKLAESRRLYTKNKKSKIKEGLSNSPLNPTYEKDGIFNYPYGKKDTNVEEFIKANPATLSLATSLVAVTGWSLIKCVKFIIKKGEDAAKLLVNLGKNSDKKTLLKKAIDKYVNN